MIEYVAWPYMHERIGEQIDEFRKINSGIHISLLGTTRGGKTTLTIGGNNGTDGILSHFENCLVIDSTGDPGAIKSYGKPVKKFGSIEGHRRLSVGDMSRPTREKIYKYIQKAVGQGNIAIYADEFRQLTDKKYFGLAPVFDYIYLFTAKKNVSLIAGTQAPRFVPSTFYDQSKMQFIFGMRDRRAMKRLAEISGDVDTLEDVIPNLRRYEFAHVGTDGEVNISKYIPKRNSKSRVITESKRAEVDRYGPTRIQLRKSEGS